MTSTRPASLWFSSNPDKAWGEKFFLLYVPVFFIYNAVVQFAGWLDVGNFWNITQNLLMWALCLVPPMFLQKRATGIALHQTYAFKFNLYMAVYIFFATYFHTEYFFDVLGLRYNFPQVTLYFDSALVGPGQAGALAEHKRIPPGMYLNAIAFFVVYHSLAVVLMRRIRNLGTHLAPAARTALWVVTVAATAGFFAWAETWFYVGETARQWVWYVDLEKMLTWGSVYYALYFLVSFPNVFRMDEDAGGERWSLSRTVIEASAVSMISLFLIDLFTLLFGARIFGVTL